MNKLALLILTAILLNSCNTVSNDEIKLIDVTGKVTFEYRGIVHALNNALVKISDKQDFTNEYGIFHLTGIEEGKYTLFVIANNADTSKFEIDLIGKNESVFEEILIQENTLSKKDYFPMTIGNSWIYDFSSHFSHANVSDGYSGVVEWEIIEEVEINDSTMRYKVADVFNGIYEKRDLNISLNIDTTFIENDTLYFDIFSFESGVFTINFKTKRSFNTSLSTFSINNAERFYLSEIEGDEIVIGVNQLKNYTLKKNIGLSHIGDGNIGNHHYSMSMNIVDHVVEK